MADDRCKHIHQCTTPNLCATTGTCRGKHVMPAPVRASDGEQSLDDLFRENAIPMSDRNARLYNRIRQALAAGVLGTLKEKDRGSTAASGVRASHNDQQEQPR